MNPSDWSIVDTDEEPGYFHDHEDAVERRRLSLRVLILCGAALVTIAAIAWVTR